MVKSKNLSLEKAEKMLRTSLEWRKDHKIDDILQTFKVPEVVEKYYYFAIIGHDREGCPVVAFRGGRCDFKGFLHCVTNYENLAGCAYVMESILEDMKQQSIKLGKRINKMVALDDYEGFHIGDVMSKPVLDTISFTLKIFDNNYPEMLKKAYVINAPKAYATMFNFVKPLLNAVTAEKINVYGTEGWKEALHKDVDPSELPEYWGGNKPEENIDPKWRKQIQKYVGGKIPKSCYRVSSKDFLESKDLETVTVPMGSTVKIEREVLAAGSTISWEFITENYEICFGISKKIGNKMEEIVKVEKVNSQYIPEEGKITSTEPATFVFIFDNTFSYLRSKKVTYLIRIFQ